MLTHLIFHISDWHCWAAASSVRRTCCLNRDQNCVCHHLQLMFRGPTCRGAVTVGPRLKKCLYMKQPLAKRSFITFYTVTSCFLVCNIWSLSQFYGAVSLYNCFLCGFTSHSCHKSQRSKATALKCSPSEDFLLVYRGWSFQTGCCCSNGERRQRALHHWGSSLRYWTPNWAEEREARAGVRG